MDKDDQPPALHSAQDGDDWSPDSWRKLPIQQYVAYPDPVALDKVFRQLSTLPPLLPAREVDELRSQLAEVAKGSRFLLQGGDCAERFMDCTEELIQKKLNIMLQMSLVMTWGARMKTVRVARMAGQFAKPRSKNTEVVDGVEVPSFRGDLINGFDVNDRQPDPQRLVQGYYHAAATLNYSQALLREGFADIHDAAKWNLGFISSSKKKEEYLACVEEVLDSLNFAHTCGVSAPSLSTVDLFVCHEGLTLEYEQALTRRKNNKWYNLGAHFLWIGDRTRQLDHAHVEYFRGISNPIGIKVGPSAKPEEIVEIVKKLWPNPAGSPGKISLITRFGHANVRKYLPAHITAMRENNLPVVWVCDPCHGNTKTEGAYKTRDVEHILNELETVFEVHAEMGSHLGGVHFELTGENVTECVGGPEDLTAEDLPQRYTTYCDPRLNYSQSMELAFLVTRLLSKQKRRAMDKSPSALSLTCLDK